MGFIHLLRKIARYLPHKRQTMMFSATMPKLIDDLAEEYLRDPVKVAVNPPGKTADRIEHAVHFTTQGDKAKLLEDYLLTHQGEAALVFNRTKHGAEKLMKLLVSWGFSAGSIHGNKSQGHRERTLAAFRSGELKVLVATDVAARGIDIPLVRHVYNYDMPNVPDNYVHRIGRTARAGASGKAVAFCAPAEMDELRAVEKVTGQPLAVIGGTPHAGGASRPTHAPRRPGQEQGGSKPRPPKFAARQGDKPSFGTDKPAAQGARGPKPNNDPRKAAPAPRGGDHAPQKPRAPRPQGQPARRAEGGARPPRRAN